MQEITIEMLHTLTQLQKNIFEVFKPAFLSKQSEELFEVPRHGLLHVGGQEWKFTKHGSGVKFERVDNGLIIDMHKFLTRPELFDACRLKHFLESSGEVSNLDEKTIIRRLDQLVTDGKLFSSTDYHYRLS